MRRLPERAARPEVGTAGVRVRVRVLADDGRAARVLVEDCGVLVRQGEVHVVPSAAIEGGTMAARCPASHPDDPTSCDGPPVVTILDRYNAGAEGCEHHGARLLASLESGRVYPLPDAPEVAAIRVYTAADTIRPFPWVDGPRTKRSQLSREENRRGGVQ